VAAKREYIKLRTPVIRFAFTGQFFKAEQYQNRGDYKYQVTGIISAEAQADKENLYKKMRQAVGGLMSRHHNKDQKKWGQWNNPLKAVEKLKKTYNGYDPGSIIITPNTTKSDDRVAPQVVDSKTSKPIGIEDFYSGCYGQLSITAAYYMITDTNYGVTFYLNNAIKTADGERLAGGGDAYSDFGIDKPSLDSMDQEGGDPHADEEVDTSAYGDF